MSNKVEQWKQRAEKAEAACAEMRGLIPDLVQGLHIKALNDPEIARRVDRAMGGWS